MATGFVFHELYLWHNTWNWSQVFPPSLTVQPGTHAENPETKRRLRNLLEVSGILDHLVTIKPRRATVAGSHAGPYRQDQGDQRPRLWRRQFADAARRRQL